MAIGEVELEVHFKFADDDYVVELLASSAIGDGAQVLRLPDERSVIEIPDSAGLGLLILSVVAGARHMVRLVLLLSDRLRTGVVVDARPTTPTVTAQPELRRGDILLIDDTGARLVKSADGGAFSDADIVATLVARARGSDDSPALEGQPMEDIDRK